jgi:Rho-binding antiterminator
VTTTDYIPIDCGIHSELELAILKRARLQLVWREADGTTYRETVTPTDLDAGNQEEYLHAVDNRGTAYRIRLDRIVRFTVTGLHNAQ